MHNNSITKMGDSYLKEEQQNLSNEIEYKAEIANFPSLKDKGLLLEGD